MDHGEKWMALDFIRFTGCVYRFDVNQLYELFRQRTTTPTNSGFLLFGVWSRLVDRNCHFEAFSNELFEVGAMDFTLDDQRVDFFRIELIQ